MLGDSATIRLKISRRKRRILFSASRSYSALAKQTLPSVANFKFAATMVSPMTARWEPGAERYSLRVSRIAITLTAVSLVAGAIACVGRTSPAASQAPVLTKTQSDAMNAYNEAASRFKSVLRQRRAQIDAKQQLPDLPGQALYL